MYPASEKHEIKIRNELKKQPEGPIPHAVL
jgi:hypothetical protein